MNNCQNCKHWQVETHRDRADLGLCGATPMYFDSVEWDRKGEKRRYKPTITATAFVQDGSDYIAELFTKPAHCCSMHEPQER